MESKKEKRYIPMEVTPETIRAYNLKAEDIEWTYIGKRKIRALMVEATEEQYLAYMRPLWKEEKREQRTREWEEKYNTGRFIALDKLYEATGYEPADPHDFLEDLYQQELMELLNQSLAMLEELDRIIITLFSENWTEAEIGKRVGLSQKAVNKRKKKILARLKQEIEKRM